MIALPDANLLLAFAWNNHPHFELAHEWMEHKQEKEWATCLVTQSAFVRLSLNPRIVGYPIPSSSVFQALERLASHPEHRFLESSPQLTDASFGEIVHRILGYRQVSDATLLCFARSNEAKLVTIDQTVGAVCPWDENLEILSLA